MTDLIRSARLGEEPALERGVQVQRLVQHLERDRGAGELVARAQHHAHAAGPEYPLDGIAPIDQSPDLISQA